MLHLKRMPNQNDGLASNFYDLDEGTAKTTMQKVVEEGKAAASEMRNGWSDSEDAFTEWIIKWIDAVGLAQKEYPIPYQCHSRSRCYTAKLTPKTLELANENRTEWY